MNSFEKARKEWDFRIDQSGRALLFWRLAACISLSLSLILSLFLMSAFSLPRYVPYVVTITDNQRVQFQGIATNHNVETTDTMVKFQLTGFIEKLRSVTTDLPFLKKNLASLYTMVSARGAKSVREYTEKKLPFDELTIFDMVEREMWRTTEILAMEKMEGSSWRVEWLETVRDKTGASARGVVSGIFSYITHDVKTSEAAEANPFGVFFDSFHIQKIKR